MALNLTGQPHGLSYVGVNTDAHTLMEIGDTSLCPASVTECSKRIPLHYRAPETKHAVKKLERDQAAAIASLVTG